VIVSTLEAEIERLKEEVATFTATVDYLTADYTRCCTEKEDLKAEVERLKRNIDGWKKIPAQVAAQYEPDAAEIERLKAEVERLTVENVQMKFALGYPMPADLERYIIPANPFRCGTCDARNINRMEATIERLTAALRGVIRVADRKTVEFDAARAALTPSKEPRP
jgi:cell division septum initiation protein DivIVA